MSITYDLELETSFTAKQVAEAIVQAVAGRFMEPDVEPETLLAPGVAFSSGTWLLTAAKTPPARPGGGLEVDFGLRPTVVADFWLNTSMDPVAQKTDMVETLAELLPTVPGDFLFHSELERALVLRREGVLYVNDSDTYWTPNLLAMLPEPYERVPLAFS